MSESPAELLRTIQRTHVRDLADQMWLVGYVIGLDAIRCQPLAPTSDPYAWHSIEQLIREPNPHPQGDRSR